MKDRVILTLGRQFGSGGRDVAQKIAEKLDIPFYDKELVKLAAKESGMSENYLDSLDENMTHSFLYSVVMGVQSGIDSYYRYNNLLDSEKIFEIQADVIRAIAEKGSCVIVGRCADYVLRNDPDLVRVFIHADLDYRIKRVMEAYDLKEKDARVYANKTDKKRVSYYNFYTNKVWGAIDNYDLSISTSRLGIDKSTELIIDYLNKL